MSFQFVNQTKSIFIKRKYLMLADKVFTCFLSKNRFRWSFTDSSILGKRNLSGSKASTNFCAILDKQICDIKDAGTYKNERVITSPQSTSITVQGSQGNILNFCANNYLGLSVSTYKHLSVRKVTSK